MSTDDSIEKLNELVEPDVPSIDETEGSEVENPDETDIETDKKCTLKYCSVKCLNVDEANLLGEISILPFDVK